MLNTTTPGKSNARATFERLAAAGVLGFITRFEATEVIAFPPHGKPPINVFSIFVAEEADGSLPPLQYLSKDGPISLAALNDWKFGIVRYHVTTEALDTELEALATNTRWQPSGKSLDTGPMREVPVQFVP